MEWKSIDLSLTCGGNVDYYRTVHHPIPTHENREHPDNFQNKSVNSAFNLVDKLQKRGSFKRVQEEGGGNFEMIPKSIWLS